jgi:ABC-type phosphate/phosphonate transport system substrate-binding protein
MSRKPLILLFFWFLGVGLSSAADPISPRTPDLPQLNVLVSDTLFAAVNRMDAIASIKVYVDALARRRKLKFSARIEIFTDTGEVVRALSANSVDVLILDTPDYLRLSRNKPLGLTLAGSNRGQLPTHQYLVLVSDPAVEQVARLAGKNLLLCSRTKADFGSAWLESLLTNPQPGGAKALFGSVKTTYRASNCVLPLFFGKADACVVDSLSFDLLKELNPQLGKLKVIARSEALIEGMVALPNEASPFRRELVESLLELHKDPDGEQLATMFRVGPMVPVPPTALENVRRLYQRLNQLPGAVPKTSQPQTASPPL